MPPADFAGRLTFSEWFPRHLSAQQRAFVNLDTTGPLRLRGAAGTGKTLAMAIKVIKLLYDAADRNVDCRVLFATHSWAGAAMVDQVLRRIDERGLLVAPPQGISLDLYPLLTLAEENRDYAAIGRRPLGIDSADGKRLSLEKINAVVDAFSASEWVAYRSGVGPTLLRNVESTTGSIARRRFCWDLLIEFGCVLAAQGILASSSERQRYLKMKRSKWMMALEGEAERLVAFALWSGFLNSLCAIE